MADQHFTATLLLDKTPEEVFQSVNHGCGWWSEEIEGATDGLGAEFTYHCKDAHRCKMKITEFVPGKKVVWLVLDNYFNFTEDKTEWKVTKVMLEISKKHDKTKPRFTHQGLVPEYESFGCLLKRMGLLYQWQLTEPDCHGKRKPQKKEKGAERKAS